MILRSQNTPDLRGATARIVRFAALPDGPPHQIEDVRPRRQAHAVRYPSAVDVVAYSNARQHRQRKLERIIPATGILVIVGVRHTQMRSVMQRIDEAVSVGKI